MCDCAVDLIDLKAKLRLMEQHYHEDMNELFDELCRLKAMVVVPEKVAKAPPLDRDDQNKVSWLYFDQEMA